MKLALAVCMAVLAVVLVQAEDEMAPPSVPAGTRVANGSPAVPRQFPYMAFITALNASGSMWYECCGSLITRSAVLTSAACVGDARMWTVRLGSIYGAGEDPNAWTLQSTWALLHPKYNNENLDNNIGIINLPRLAPLNEFIQPVSLPSSPVVSTYIGREGIVSGWGETHPSSGYSDVLLWAKVLVIHNEHCKKVFSNHAVTDRSLCAGSFSTTAYWGDWGAPLVLYNRGRYIQIGIVSTFWSYNTSSPGLYTRVTSFMDWIKMTTESD